MSPTSKPRIKPLALQPGDTVGIIAPASNFKRDLLEAGCKVLSDLGYKPFYFDSIFEQDLYFAGSVDRRVQEFEQMLSRDDVRAIMCTRGGYGSNYLLPHLNATKIAAAQKIFIGYSDITSLLTWFTNFGLVTFHGPMVAADFSKQDGVDLSSLQAALSGSSSWTVEADIEPLVEGSAEGTLYGGCLSILVASLGTPYEIQSSGTILFIEDINAKPYQIDRMLMQLKLAGKFSGVRGLIFGEMLDCIQNTAQGYKLQEVILRVVGDLGIPIGFGLRSGHVSHGNITLPFGVQARLTVGDGVTLEILESATVPRKS
jgi:muramoyltetrapeptide carboxypeptidase